MLIDDKGNFELNNLYPSSNYTGNTNFYVVDENTLEGGVIAFKIIDNYPRIKPVIENSEVIDVEVYEQVILNIPDTIIIGEEVTITTTNSCDFIVDNELRDTGFEFIVVFESKGEYRLTINAGIHGIVERVIIVE